MIRPAVPAGARGRRPPVRVFGVPGRTVAPRPALRSCLRANGAFRTKSYFR